MAGVLWDVEQRRTQPALTFTIVVETLLADSNIGGCLYASIEVAVLEMMFNMITALLLAIVVQTSTLLPL